MTRLDSPLPDNRLLNGAPVVGSTGRPNSWGGTNWPNGPAGGTIGGIGKPPPGRDPKSRARSRDYLKQYVCAFLTFVSSLLAQNLIDGGYRCLQEISYLTSPQAMNPLPNRPLLNSTSVPLSLPNLPPFEQIAYNRPRKVLPEAGKDFPLMNGHAQTSGPSPAPVTSGSQLPLLERSHTLSSGTTQQQSTGQPSQHVTLSQPSSILPSGEREKEGESEGRLTAIFRPDDAGEWREKLRISHETSEQLRLVRDTQSGPWDRPRYDDEDSKEDDGEVEEEDNNIVDEGEGNKVWKAKRTLRKSVG